jgi:hypothetical protein
MIALRVRITFASFESMPATSFARLLCDLQHLTLVVVASTIPERMPLSSAVFDPALQKYSAFIEMRPQAFGLAEVEVVLINKGSPLWIEFLLKLPRELVSPVSEAFRLVFNRLYFPELEYRRKAIAVHRESIAADRESIGAQREAEALRQDRLRSFAQAINLEKTISDPETRALFLRGLRSSLRQLETTHPEIQDLRTSEDGEEWT